MQRLLLLRGINLGPNRRLSMRELRAALDAAGYGPVRTHLQSGNVMLASDAPADALVRAVGGLIEQRFGLEVPIVTRSGPELAAVIAADPLAGVAGDPKRYQVSFCATEPAPEAIERVRAAAVGEERVAVRGREIYAWHPAGVARSKLWNTLAGGGLGTMATTRNWATVCALHEMIQAAERG